jgi:surface protein
MKNRFIKFLIDSFNYERNNALAMESLKLVAQDREHLEKLIKREISTKGNNCSLNHIHIEKITDLNGLFAQKDFGKDFSEFNGDISGWNTSNVIDMKLMFYCSAFNGDIAKWNTSNVKDMMAMFQESKFNGDISKWDISNVESISFMFEDAKFKGDLSDWKPYKAEHFLDTFLGCDMEVPYWGMIEDKKERKVAIDKYWLNKELNRDLIKNAVSKNKKLKI